MSHLLVRHFIHNPFCLQDVALADANKLHLQGDRPIRGIKVEHALIDVDSQELGHILVAAVEPSSANNKRFSPLTYISSFACRRGYSSILYQVTQGYGVHAFICQKLKQIRKCIFVSAESVFQVFESARETALRPPTS